VHGGATVWSNCGCAITAHCHHSARSFGFSGSWYSSTKECVSLNPWYQSSFVAHRGCLFMEIWQAYTFATHHWHIGSIDGPLCGQHATKNDILSFWILPSCYQSIVFYDITLRLMVLPIRGFTEISLVITWRPGRTQYFYAMMFGRTNSQTTVPRCSFNLNVMGVLITFIHTSAHSRRIWRS
jgi:hypothetical protein